VLRTLILLAVFMLMAVEAMAGEALGLREAVNLALEKNSLLLAAGSEQSAAEAGVTASRSRYLPRLFFEERAASTNSGTRAFMMRLDEGRFSLGGDLNHPSTTSDMQTTFSIEQPLFDLSIGSGIQAAREEVNARSFSLENKRQEVAFQVYAAYLAVQKAHSQLAVSEEAVSAAREHLRLAGVRTAEGVGLKFDELRIGTFLSDMEQQRITAENELRIARLRLGLVTGLPAGAAPDVSEQIRPAELHIEADELAREAESGRRDLQELAAEVAKADAAVAAVRGSYWPTVYASASYQMNDRDIPFGRDNDSWLVAATLRWEFFDGFRRQGELSRARASRDAAESYLNNQRREAALQVRESLLRRTETASRLEVGKNAVKDAEEMVRLINKRFENALATTVELLDAQTALNRTRSHLVENEAAHALATAQVYRTAGLFLKEMLK